VKVAQSKSYIHNARLSQVGGGAGPIACPGQLRQRLTPIVETLRGRLAIVRLLVHTADPEEKVAVGPICDGAVRLASTR
jgi:hypothetical protein